MSKELIAGVVKRVGTQVKFADLVNQTVDEIWQVEQLPAPFKPPKIRQAHVWNWINGGRIVAPPPSYVRAVVKVANAHGMAVKAADFRPDVFGAEQGAA